MRNYTKQIPKVLLGTASRHARKSYTGIVSFGGPKHMSVSFGGPKHMRVSFGGPKHMSVSLGGPKLR